MPRNRAVLFGAVFRMLCAVLVVVRAGPAVAQEPTEEVVTSDSAQPQGVEANVGSGFTYQGYLEDGNQPANGTYDLQLMLYDADTGGTLIDSTTADDVSVADGRFTTPLTFGTNTFDGTELWLEVRVRPGSSGGAHTTLSPRQLIQPAPYANTLRPGALIAATYRSTLLTVDNDDNRGMYVEAGDDGIQVTAGSPDFFGYALGAGTGLEVNAENHGVFVGRANQYGVWVNNTGNHGIRVSNAGGDGIRVENATGYGGHFVHNDSGTAVLAHGKGTGDSEGVIATVESDAGEALEVLNTGGSSTAHIFLACSSNNCGDIEMRVRRNGNVSADGSFTGGGADYADMLAVAGDESQYTPGHVLAVGPDGTLTLSSQPYDPAVIGVYSTQPAFVGDPRGTGQRIGKNGEVLPEESEKGLHTTQMAASDGLVPVALVGVVPVKVSGENGAIVPGDLLVSSSVAGHAMKAGGDPPQGTVIGKAMQPFGADAGIIKMLVMLQ